MIAEVSASLPRLVKPVGAKSGACLRLASLMSYDRELTEEATRAGNRLHDLLLSTCPALEAHLAGKRLQSQLYLTVLARYGGCHGLEKAARGNVRRWAKARRGMGPAALTKIDELFEVVSRQTVSLPGTAGTEELVKLEASYLLATLKSRKEVAAKRDEALSAMPEAQILMTLPGLGAVTCATFLSEVGDDGALRHQAARRQPQAQAGPRAVGEQVHALLRRVKGVLRQEEGRGAQLRIGHHRPCEKEAERHVRDAA